MMQHRKNHNLNIFNVSLSRLNIAKVRLKLNTLIKLCTANFRVV
jgi:hypothetical protein